MPPPLPLAQSGATWFTLKMLLSRNYTWERIMAGLTAAREPAPTLTDRAARLLGAWLAPRLLPVYFSGAAMQPTFNPSIASISPSSSTPPGELLLVHKLDHIMADHERFEWILPDVAEAALDEEARARPNVEHLALMRDQKFMRFLRPVNSGDVVLLRNPIVADEDETATTKKKKATDDMAAPAPTSIDMRGLAAAGGVEMHATSQEKETIISATRLGAPSTPPSSSSSSSSTSRLSPYPEYLVRRIAAVQGQDMLHRHDASNNFTLQPGTCWVVAENDALSRVDAPDSRLFGPLPLSLIVGRVIYRIGTFDRHIVENNSFSSYYDNQVLEREGSSFDQAMTDEDMIALAHVKSE